MNDGATFPSTNLKIKFDIFIEIQERGIVLPSCRPVTEYVGVYTHTHTRVRMHRVGHLTPKGQIFLVNCNLCETESLLETVRNIFVSCISEIYFFRETLGNSFLFHEQYGDVRFHFLFPEIYYGYFVIKLLNSLCINV